jgi:hypothetical protein
LYLKLNSKSNQVFARKCGTIVWKCLGRTRVVELIFYGKLKLVSCMFIIYMFIKFNINIFSTETKAKKGNLYVFEQEFKKSFCAYTKEA